MVRSQWVAISGNFVVKARYQQGADSWAFGAVVDSLVSRQSKAFQALDIDFDALSLKQAVDLLAEKPAILRRPIIVDERRLLFGFNQDSVRVFLPREVRRQKLWTALLNTPSVWSVPTSVTCGAWPPLTIQNIVNGGFFSGMNNSQ